MVSCKCLITETHVQSQGTPYETYGEQTGTVFFILLILCLFLQLIHQPTNELTMQLQ